jgi:hypothetical protein
MNRRPRQIRPGHLAVAFALAALGSPIPARDAIYAIAEPGPRLLRVDLTDGNRAVVSGQVVAGVSTSFARMRDRDASLVYEQDSAALFLVDAANDAPVPFTGRALGSDDGFAYDTVGVLHDIVPNAAGRVFVTGHRQIEGPILFEVDPATGDRRAVAGRGVGSGPLYGVYFEAAAEGNSHVVVHDCVSRPTILRVNVDTGERQIVSGESPFRPFTLHGAGPEFLFVTGIDVAPDGSIYVLCYRGGAVDGVAPSIVRVDPVTGDRTTVSNFENGEGPPVAFDLAVVDDAWIVASSENGQVLLVDVANGNRRVLTGPGMGSGPELFRVDNLDYDASQNLVYAYDYNLKELVSIDLATGDRARAWRNDAGSGPPLGGASNRRGLLAMEEEAPGALLGLGVIDEAEPTASTFLMRIDLATGARSIVADPATGSGPLLAFPGDVMKLPDGTVIVADGVEAGDADFGRILSVDPVTGDRELLSADGAEIGVPHDLERDPATGAVYMAERLRLLRFDPATWEHEVLAEDPTGEGLEIALESICLAADGYLYAQHLVPEVTFYRFDTTTWERETVLVQPGLVFPSSLSDLDASFQGRPIYKGPNSRLWRMILPDGTLREYGTPTTTTAFRPALNRAAAFLVADDGLLPPGFAFALR